MSCNDAHISSAFPANIGSESNNSENSSSQADLEAICCICEKGIADDIAKQPYKVVLPDQLLLLVKVEASEIKFLFYELPRVLKRSLFGVLLRKLMLTEFLEIWPVLAKSPSLVEDSCIPYQSILV